MNTFPFRYGDRKLPNDEIQQALNRILEERKKQQMQEMRLELIENMTPEEAAHLMAFEALPEEEKRAILDRMVDQMDKGKVAEVMYEQFQELLSSIIVEQILKGLKSKGGKGE